MVITSSSGNNGYTYVYIYTNPVSSQGWMNLNLSGNNSSGGGGSSNGGNGGSSNNAGMPLFPCDNPTPHGCEEEEDDRWESGDEILDGPDDPINDVNHFFDCFNSSQGAVLTVYVNEPNPGSGNTHNGTSVGHTFVSLQQGNNVSTFGYYPVSDYIYPSINNSSSAILGNDGSGNESFSASISTNVTGNQLQKILNASINFNSTYHLDTYNCTDFAIDLGNLAGMNLPESNGTWPGGGGSNPGTLGKHIRNLNTSNNVPTNTTGGGAPATNKEC